MFLSRTAHPAIAQPSRSPLTGLLPREHGSWALALEPVALALIAAPSWAGAALSAGVVGLFLMRRPWQIATTCRDGQRVRQAWSVLAVLSGVAVVGGGLSIQAASPWISLPLLIAGVMGALFAWFDERREGRDLAAELAGAGCFAAFASAITLCSGRSADGWLALVIGGFSFGRALTSIVPIRVYLRRRKGEAVGGMGAVAVAAGFPAVAVASTTVTNTWIPAFWACLFLARTIWLVGPRPPVLPARRLGIFETVLGTAAVITTGWALQ